MQFRIDTSMVHDSQLTDKGPKSEIAQRFQPRKDARPMRSIGTTRRPGAAMEGRLGTPY